MVSSRDKRNVGDVSVALSLALRLFEHCRFQVWRYH
jgi:hypothetical protein